MLIIPPLHSVTSPTVGVGYLKASLEHAGIECPTIDLNIELFQHLKDRDISVEWLHWLFPFGERTYGAELLMSQVCFDRSTSHVLAACEGVKTEPFRLFLNGLNTGRWLRDSTADFIRREISEFLEKRTAELAERARTWIGISVVVTSVPAAIYLVRQLRQMRPELRIVLGGPHFHRENVRPWIEALPEIDAIIVGDARQSLIEWILEQQQSTRGMLVQRREMPDRIHHQPAEDQVSAPHADWSDFNLNAYEGSIVAPAAHESRMPVIPIHGAFGCSYNRCTFCYEVLLTPRFIPRSVDNVVDEVVHQRAKHNTELFFFTDLDFNSDYHRTLTLCNALTHRAPGIRFACWLRAHELDDCMLNALYDAGCRQFFIGLEAVADRLLNLMAKGYTAEHAIRVLRILAEFGNRHTDAVYAFNLITNYPGERLDDVRQTLALVRDEPDLFQKRVAALFEFALTSNTIAWKRRQAIGITEVEGFEQLLLPETMRTTIPSHRYWYPEPSDDYATRVLLWDVLRGTLGHSPRYLSLM